MSINNFSNFNMPSLNGLIDINADSVSSDTINTNTIYVDGIDIAQQVIDNSQKLTAITYTDTPTPTTTIDSNLVVSELAEFDANVSVNGNMNLTGNMTIYDTLDNTKNMSLYYHSASSGFRFQNNTPNDIIYFTVRDPTNTFSKSFQFRWNQFFCDIPMYVFNSDFTVDGGSVYVGSGRFFFLYSSNATDGLRVLNTVNNFYTNFYNMNNSGLDINVFRLHYSRLDSLVPHYFNSTVDISGNTTLNTLTQNGNLTLNGNLIANSATITPIELSYLDGTSSNIQTQLNSKANTSGAIFSGSVVFNAGFVANATTTYNAQPIFNDKLQCYSNIKLNSTAGIELSTLTISQTELGYLSGVTSSIQTQFGDKLSKSSGGTIVGNIITNGTVQMNNAININSDITQFGNLNQYTSSILWQENVSGSTTGTNSLKLTDFFDSISFSGSSSSKNKITTTNIYTGDVTGQANILKYTYFKYNSNSATGTTSPCASFIDNYNNSNLSIFPNSTAGAFNDIVVAGSNSIINIGSKNLSNLCVSVWSSIKTGLLVQAINSLTTLTQIWSGSNYVSVHSINGVTMSGITSLGFSGGKTIDGNYGTIQQASLTSTVALTTGVEANVSSAPLSLPAGTYIISWIGQFHVLTGATTIGNYSCGYTTSATAYTDYFSRGSYLNVSAPLDTYFSLTGSTTVSYASATNIYMRCSANFGTASRLEFVGNISSLRAVKIA